MGDDIECRMKMKIYVKRGLMIDVAACWCIYSYKCK